MKIPIKRLLFESPILNTAFNTLITLLFSAAILVVAINTLSLAELNFWLLISALMGISQGLTSALGATYIRFLSYSSEGVRIHNFSDIYSQVSAKVFKDADELEYAEIYFVMRKVYLLATIFFAAMLGALLPFILSLSINSLPNPQIGWLVAVALVLIVSVTIYTSHYRNILMSTNRVAISSRLEALVKLIAFIVIIPFLYVFESLLFLSLSYPIVILISFLIQRIYCSTNLNDFRSHKTAAVARGQAVFMATFGSLWRTGLTSVVVNVMKYLSPIIVGMLYSPVAAAPFLLTKRIFDIIEQLTMAPFNARNPRFAKLRATGQLSVLVPYLRQTQAICYAIFLFCFIMLVTLSELILVYLQADVSLSPPGIIIVLAFAGIWSRWGGMAMLISNQSNKVIEHKQAIVAAVSFACSLLIMYPLIDLYAFPCASFLGVLFASPLILESYKGLRTTFFVYEKFVFILSNFVLIFLSAIYLQFSLEYPIE